MTAVLRTRCASASQLPEPPDEELDELEELEEELEELELDELLEPELELDEEPLAADEASLLPPPPPPPPQAAISAGNTNETRKTDLRIVNTVALPAVSVRQDLLADLTAHASCLATGFARTPVSKIPACADSGC
ncbi:hypothetical protein Q9Q94_08880 [Uliginosibacterium sp. 31-16]|uniref:hypothetical protein n=1 Tax=Uliginosibacterium sp. 31-16 TaxID=3068315 RepID=UPI00273D9FE0|nr:hypothetical protein [Uliginosibacterium sp. 31-16]MDP5239642.1 hypothetical protein [Uliginosibacterium sp. 31-16]